MAQPADPGWPRVYAKDGKELIAYQPQVDSWKEYSVVHFRCAIAVKGVLAEEKFGVAEVDASTVVDHASRVVAITPITRHVRFAKVSDAEAATLRAAIEDLHPSTSVTVLALDRVLAYVDGSKQPTQRKAEVNLEPPKIFYSEKPALLVDLMGPPRLGAVSAGRTDLMFVVNTNWDVLYDTASKQYYLLDGDGWLMTGDLLKGPWQPAGQLPRSFDALPGDANWAEARKHIPGTPPASVPAMFVSTEPAELIVTAGPPEFAAIATTRLMRVVNTESPLFLNTADGQYYFLVAGRWFRGGKLSGPWSAASADLPGEFAKIPDGDPSAFVKACVPGTQQAQDAVLLASIPTTTQVNLNEPPKLQVTYAGEPQFAAIQGATGVQSAVNSPFTVFLVGGNYYCCQSGIWYNAAAPKGPWTFCSSVPPPIYTIPPSSPAYNVTYVTVQSAGPGSVTYSQTAGYSGEYVAATGVLMFGAGMLTGAAIANANSGPYYYPPYPACYSYGCGATYHYGYGGYASASYAHYGPYGGAGYTAAYNPSTGTYGRSAYAYGPYSAAGAKAAYNPYTGGYAAAAGVSTPYGAAGRAAGYNPNTGTYARAGARTGEYGSAAGAQAYNPRTGAYAQGGAAENSRGEVAGGSAYNPNTGKGVAGGAVSGQYGSAGAVKTNQGTGAAGWDTKNGQGAVAKTQSGDVYAAHDNTLYKKNPNGGWESNSGSGWQSASKSESSQMEQQAQSRQQANQRTQSANEYRSSSERQGGGYSGSGSRSAGRSFSGGGGREGRR